MARLGPMLSVVSAGGVIGALARYAVDSTFTWSGPPALPWGTFAINIIGSLALGLLIPTFTHRWSHPLLRPFLAIGILGGFTTFSALALQGLDLLQAGDSARALLYLLGSVVIGVLAAQFGLALSARWLSSRRAHRSHRGRMP